MIKLAGISLAESKQELIESLFKSGGTCCGYIKRYKKQINIYDMQDNIIGAINKELLLVKAKVRKDIDGKVWYSYGTPELFKDKDEKELFRDMAALSIGHDHKGYYFK